MTTSTTGGSGMPEIVKVILWVAVAVIVAVLTWKFVASEFFEQPFELKTFKGLTTPTPSATAQAPVQTLPQPVKGTTNDCPRVTDAVEIANTVCGANRAQYSWRGHTNICMAPKPKASSYLCHNQKTGMLAWYNP